MKNDKEYMKILENCFNPDLISNIICNRKKNSLHSKFRINFN